MAKTTTTNTEEPEVAITQIEDETPSVDTGDEVAQEPKTEEPTEPKTEEPTEPKTEEPKTEEPKTEEPTEEPTESEATLVKELKEKGFITVVVGPNGLTKENLSHYVTQVGVASKLAENL